jgi:hypothetical protein
MRARTTKSKLSRLPATGQQQAQRLIATDERVPQSPPLCSQHQLTAQTNDPGPSLMATGGADDRRSSEPRQPLQHNSQCITLLHTRLLCCESITTFSVYSSQKTAPLCLAALIVHSHIPSSTAALFVSCCLTCSAPRCATSLHLSSSSSLTSACSWCSTSTWGRQSVLIHTTSGMPSRAPTRIVSMPHCVRSWTTCRARDDVFHLREDVRAASR